MTFKKPNFLYKIFKSVCKSQRKKINLLVKPGMDFKTPTHSPKLNTFQVLPVHSFLVDLTILLVLI